MDGLVSDEVQENFATAIEDRDGARLDNRVIAIDSAAITGAEMIGQMAEVTVRFIARISQRWHRSDRQPPMSGRSAATPAAATPPGC